jgi:hypothetical protein
LTIVSIREAAEPAHRLFVVVMESVVHAIHARDNVTHHALGNVGAHACAARDRP